MKLWFVLRIAEAVAATWGPLPYGMDECLRRRDEKVQELQQAFAEKGGQVSDGTTSVRLSDVRISCSWSEERPR